MSKAQRLTELIDWLTAQSRTVLRFKRAEQRASELGLNLDDPVTMRAIEKAGWRSVSPSLLVNDSAVAL